MICDLWLAGVGLDRLCAKGRLGATMVTLRAPALGPIVGHTTDTTCRIWIRADSAGDNAQNPSSERVIGVIGVVNPANKIGDAWYFRLHREDDRTGAFNLGDFVQLGMHSDDIALEQK